MRRGQGGQAERGKKLGVEERQRGKLATILTLAATLTVLLLGSGPTKFDVRELRARQRPALAGT